MSFLRRLVKPSETNYHLTATWFSSIRDSALVSVVGEAYRQEDVLAAKPPGPGQLPPGLPPPPAGYYKAMLIPEPKNQYDPNAVMVRLWAGKLWRLCGYLSREDAALYRPLFLHLGRDGRQPSIACDAATVPERGGVGVILHLGTPGECIAELITDDRTPAAHPWTAGPIVFTGNSRTTITGVVIDRPAQLMLARWAGCVVLPRITKKAIALIVADPDDPTGNSQKAREYGIPIVRETDFLVGIGLPPEAIGRDTTRWARG